MNSSYLALSLLSSSIQLPATLAQPGRAEARTQCWRELILRFGRGRELVRGPIRPAARGGA